MDAINVAQGGAQVTMEPLVSMRRASSTRSVPQWCTDDLLAATAAGLRAASDPRADAVQALVERER